MNTIDTQARALLMGRRRTIRKLFENNLDEEKRIHEEVEPDWLDRAAAQESAEVLERLSDTERRELAQIDAALERIAKGTYGRCDQCSAPIGRQRLRAIPEARFCIGCTERIESAA